MKIKVMSDWLQQNANAERYLFMLKDLKALYPKLSNAAFKTFISRLVKDGVLEKICRFLYAYKSTEYSSGLLLFHAASYLRSHEFNYISLETALSDAGIISQIPINTITIMSSGRSNRISCNKFGIIEFVHTKQKPEEIMDQLTYDVRCKLWRANIKLAVRDMKRTHRNCDLIDWDAVNEFI